MSNPSQSEGIPENEIQADAVEPAAEAPMTEANEELTAEELDEVSGAGLISLTTGTTTTTVSSTPPPPPASVTPINRSPGS